jgi:hypothetical protein
MACDLYVQKGIKHAFGWGGVSMRNGYDGRCCRSYDVLLSFSNEGSIFLGLQEHVAARFLRPAFVDVPLGLANHGEMAKLFQSDFAAAPKGRS